MTTATRSARRKPAHAKTKIGPFDHGLVMSWAEFTRLPSLDGFRYELIDGRLNVSPLAELPHQNIVEWLGRHLRGYSDVHPSVINRVATPARVFVPGRKRVTAPEPDLAAYGNFPVGRGWNEVRWREVSPVLVVEVVSGSVDKDLRRNVELYLQVPSIREYWVVLGEEPIPDLFFRVYRRRGTRWLKPLDFRLGDVYTTKLLPGFRLVLDPDRR